MTTSTKAGSRLSLASEYEQTFGTRHRPPGRPSGRDTDDVLFPRDEVPDLIGRVAERRAYALVHERYRDELGELYRAELKVLMARGVETVAADVGIKLQDGFSRRPENI